MVFGCLALHQAVSGAQRECRRQTAYARYFVAERRGREVRAVDAPLSKLAQEALQSYRNYRRNEASELAHALPLNEYLVIQIRNSMAQIMRRFDYGMTALASIGATAPFIGLFGTVWGIYHALIISGKAGR
ncbi:ExbB [Neisseria meningitidis M6190]|nr:ExbB [Neisseria meningitidis M6190]